MVQDRNCLIFYTTAVCNLKCVYCFIDKNPALKKIDDILDESFKGDYYFDFARKMFPDPMQLREVQIWGGEPSLRLDRCYHTVERLIANYPNLCTFMMSTNFTGDNWFDQFYGLMNVLGKFPNKRFMFNLQLSIDGPTDINDRQRGKGVTKLFTEHFMRLIDTAELSIPKNIDLHMFFKPTLTSELFPGLQTREQIINYFKFFELYYDAYHFKVKDKQRINLTESVPNTACPSPHTKEDGILFANLCRICREITNDIRAGNSPLKYYRNIVPFARDGMCYNYECVSYKSCKGHCGSGHTVIGLLPYNMISACHNGFTDLLGEYKNYCARATEEGHAIDFRLFLNDSHIMIHNEESFAKYEKMVQEFFIEDSTAQGANMAGVIRMLASDNQIDAKYKDSTEALKAAVWIRNSTSYCVRDNIGSTGSLVMPPVGLFKLLLNGAREYIEDVK